MTGDSDANALLSMMSARRGHFTFVSGHHGELWLDVNALFAHLERVAPFVHRLAESLRGHRVEAICGAPDGGTILARMLAGDLGIPSCLESRGRVAVVDDVINAGTDVRATLAQVRAAGAYPIVIGALLVLGSSAGKLARAEGCSLVTVATLDHTLWEPSACPLCAAGIPIQSIES